MKKKKGIIPIILFCLLSFNLFAQKAIKHLVALNNCGVKNEQPFLIKGSDWKIPNSSELKTELLTCNFGGKIVYAFDKMNIHGGYILELSFLADDKRIIRLIADGNPISEDIVIPRNKVVKKRIELPRKSYAYGQLVLIFSVVKGANAVVSQIKLFSDDATKLQPFPSDRKRDLANTPAYKVDSTVCVEKVLPNYAPIPAEIPSVYKTSISLNGSWLFCDKEEGNKWEAITVPGQWSMQGYKVDSAAWGKYKRTFLLPKDWEKQNVNLRFDGVHSECVVFINGKKVGEHQGAMTPFELSIAPFLKSGENQVEVKVKSESLSDMLGSLTQYAAHQLGGITRKVTLFALPKLHVTRMLVSTDLDENYKNAIVKGEIWIKNDNSKAVSNASLHLLLKEHGAVVTRKIEKIAANETRKIVVELPVESPVLWNNEHPHLYTLTTSLLQENVVERIDKRIGIREIEVKGNQLFVNGKEVKLHGVCRHEAHPLSGRVLTDELRYEDALIYLKGNCNFIRTSHYPPGEAFLEACDELGLFVEVEAPICWIGHHANENWQKLNYQDAKYYDYVLQANMENITFNYNHPSILFWSVANESYWNQHFAQVAEYVRKADTTRPYAFHDQGYGGFNNQGSTAPITNIHYPGAGGYKVAAKSKRPMTYGEFCHLNVYNRRELVTDPGIRNDWALALAPTWENMYRTKGVLGGSIWSGIDDIFQLPNGDAVGYGAWGPIDGWRRAKPEYWDMKKIYSPIKVMTKELTPNNLVKIEVENRYLFTNLNEVTALWQCGTEKGRLKINCMPSQKTTFEVPVKGVDDEKELILTFYSPKGFMIDTYSIPIGLQKKNQVERISPVKTKLSEKKNYYKIKGKNFLAIINKKSGQIDELNLNKKSYLVGGPTLMALPLVGGGCYPNHNALTPAFNETCSQWKVEKITATTQDDNVVITVTGQYEEMKGSYTMTINASGILKLTYTFTALKNINPRQWGMTFDAPSSFDKVFWRRKGMWSIYPNQHIGRTEGEAELFYACAEKINPRIQPTWAWSKDANKLGSNDFRSTRRNIYYAGLKEQTSRITALSDGSQHWRSWKEEGAIRFLVADFVTAGNEMFLGGYYAPYRKKINKGDTINGTIELQLN